METLNLAIIALILSGASLLAQQPTKANHFLSQQAIPMAWL
ncbi:MAG: hypothetical protein ACI9JZ_001612 [Lentimonas sp.]|jgi:hypothetical protein